MPAAEVVSSYKSLELVERAFRNLKTVQLEVRPVYHKTDERIRSRIVHRSQVRRSNGCQNWSSDDVCNSNNRDPSCA